MVSPLLVNSNQTALCCSALVGHFLPGPIVPDQNAAGTVDVEDLISFLYNAEPEVKQFQSLLIQEQAHQATTHRTWPGSKLQGGLTGLCLGLLGTTAAAVPKAENTKSTLSLEVR